LGPTRTENCSILDCSIHVTFDRFHHGPEQVKRALEEKAVRRWKSVHQNISMKTKFREI
jgi:hypothetical protein